MTNQEKTGPVPLLIKVDNSIRVVTIDNLKISIKSVAYEMYVDFRNSMFFVIGSILLGYSLLVLPSVPLVLWLCIYFMLIPFVVSTKNILIKYVIFKAIIQHFGLDINQTKGDS